MLDVTNCGGKVQYFKKSKANTWMYKIHPISLVIFMWSVSVIFPTFDSKTIASLLSIVGITCFALCMAVA